MQTDLLRQFTVLQNFGRSVSSACYSFEPTSPEEIQEAFELARQTGLTVAARGAGRSYNDAALNSGRIVLDLSRLNRITAWDTTTGRLTCQPGVTLEQAWQRVEPEGWWPPVVSGTMRTTVGGCLAANIHGKNNFQGGPIGEHVVEFTAALPDGSPVTCSPERNEDLFHAMIGGFGMLGIFTSVTIQMKPVHSGLLHVDAWPVPDLKRHLDALLQRAGESDYIVGWLDATAGGRGLGRGQIHAARYLLAGEDPAPHQTRLLQNQVLPDRLFLLLPKSMLHRLMRPFSNNLGWSLINSARYLTALRRHSFRQPHAAFHFLLDYIPDWERSYGPGGLIQYQSFLPKESAQDAWAEILRISQRRRMPAYLGVTKRHRRDRFLLSHAVDGFSLALDYKVTDSNRRALARMLEDFDSIVLQAGGRFYFAKNSETSAETARHFLGEQVLERFRVLKRRCDPDGILESDLYRRVFSQLDGA